MSRSKSQKLATFLTLAGFIMAVAAVAYSISELQSLNSQVEQKRLKSDSLNIKIDELKLTIDKIKNGPISELITPKAIAVRLEGRRAQNGRQLFNFVLWIDLPNYRKSDIQSVKYHFGHSSMLMKERTGKQASNGFAVNYTGWGCLGMVTLTVVLQNQQEVTIDFPMCDEIVIQ